MFNNKGGKVIASGGYGCVFSPALKCEGSNKRDKNKISKLMTERHAKDEYDEINSIKEKLKDIPDYKDYFLVSDLTLCKPEKLEKTDLKSFKKCSALPKDKITKNNINDSLDKVLALNMPNGGIPVDDYIYDNGSFEKLLNTNNALIKLLQNGIIPMNAKNIYHCDIKDSNILVVEQNNKLLARLIDWGLTTQYVANKDSPFPKTWRNRPLQFNVPFSVILFSDSFVQKYTEYILDNGKLDEDSLRPFVIDYIHFWIKERGAGHYRFINQIMGILFSRQLTSVNETDRSTLIENDFTMTYITNYIIDILIHFTRFRKNGTLNMRIYLDTVFIKIVDIWGFVSTYFPILEFFNENYDNLTEEQEKMSELIKGLFIKYLYSPRIEPVNEDDLVSDLKTLSVMFSNEISSVTAKGIKPRPTKTKKNKITKNKRRTHSRLRFKKPIKSKSKTKKKLFMLSTKLKTTENK
jgi:serine/threonine protein kinase